MRFFIATIGLLIVVALPLVASAEEFKVEKIWDAAPHNAFTDLIRWKDRFYCTFRESAHHVPKSHEDDGKIRILASNDGKTWESVALLTKDEVDLRDSKLSITPDGRLMAVMGGSYYTFDGGKAKRILMAPQVAFMSEPEKGFGPVTPVEIDPKVQSKFDWLWRVTWKDGVGYGMLYQADYSKKDNGLHLLKTTDGIRYELVKTLDLPGRVGESTVRFDPDGTMRVVVRTGSGDYGHLGLAKAPYTDDWTWKKIDLRLGGPDAIRLPNGKWILGTRFFCADKTCRTSLLRLYDDGHAETVVQLPSGGDTSYPGLCIHDGKLWVSYYSSHEGKSSIYLATVPLSWF